jgi:hypothetical protein
MEELRDAEVLKESPTRLAAMASDDALVGEAAGWVNLRRDGLQIADVWGPAGKIIQWALAVGVAAGLLLPISLFVRAYRYDKATNDLLEQQRAI